MGQWPCVVGRYGGRKGLTFGAVLSQYPFAWRLRGPGAGD